MRHLLYKVLNKVFKFTHWIDHLFKWNKCRVVTWFVDDDTMAIGIQCLGCEQISDAVFVKIAIDDIVEEPKNEKEILDGTGTDQANDSDYETIPTD